MRALLVDDSNMMKQIETEQLQNLGIHDIIEASNGQEGLDQLEKNMPVDLMLLDINMPVMDGLTMLKKVRSQEEYNNLKIIIVSTEGQHKMVLEAIRSGADDYLVKPFTEEDFRFKVNLAIS